MKPDRQNRKAEARVLPVPRGAAVLPKRWESLILSGHRRHFGPFLCLSVCLCRLHMAASQTSRVLFQSSREMTNNDWREVIASVLRSPHLLRLCSAFLGIIILIECRWCRVGFFFFSPYRAERGRRRSWRSGDCRRHGGNRLIKHLKWFFNLQIDAVDMRVALL